MAGFPYVLHHFSNHFTDVDGVTTAVSVAGVTAVVFTSLAFIEQHDEELLVFFAFAAAVVEQEASSAAVHSLFETFFTEADVLLQQEEEDFAFFADAFSSQFAPAVDTANEAAATIAVIAIMRIFISILPKRGVKLMRLYSNDSKNRP